MNVLGIGDCGIDHYLPQHECRAGGITLNFAVNMRACLDAADRVGIVAPLGDDDAAHIVRRRVQHAGLDATFVTLPGSTPVQYIEVDRSGERHFVRYEEGVLRDFRVDTDTGTRIAGVDLLVTPVFEQNRATFASVMRYASGAACVAVDFADFGTHPDFELLDAHLADVDVAFFGLDLAQQALIAALAARATAPGPVIVVTLGAAGSRAYAGTACHVVPAVPVARVVDTTGAGDAYAAGFLSCYCRNGTIEDALARGAEMAARSIGRAGGA